MHCIICDRKTIYEEIWKEPMIVVAKRYNVSNNYLKKICKKLNIPIPGPGHWTKVKYGEKVSPPKLPPYNGPEVGFYTPRLRKMDIEEENQRNSKQREDLKDFEILKEEALDWELAMKIRSYIYAAESRILSTKMPENKKSRLIKKIKWAKGKADWLDPFIATDDPILGKKRGKRGFFFDNGDN